MTLRVVALLAWMSALPIACARRDQRTVEVSEHDKHTQTQTVQLSLKDMRDWATRHHNKKFDTRCASECVNSDGKCVAGNANKHWASFCQEWCDQATVAGLCLTPEDKEEAVEKVDDPQPMTVDERVNDQSTKKDDVEDEELEEEEEEEAPKKCFPADASVETQSGPKRMSELRVGDAVQAVNGAGEVFFDDVYFFGHADASATAEFVTLKFSGSSLELSDRHFIPTCPEHGVVCGWEQHVHVYAQEVQTGDFVWKAGKSGMHLQKVLQSSLVIKQGLFNPYTLSGKIVVNGVVASAHSEWVLDSVLPSVCMGQLPAVYQAMFLPGRWLYHLVGPNAADMLDVDSPSRNGYGSEFLAAFASIVVAGFLACPSKRLI